MHNAKDIKGGGSNEESIEKKTHDEREYKELRESENRPLIFFFAL